jgi:hypothetical protein
MLLALESGGFMKAGTSMASSGREQVAPSKIERPRGKSQARSWVTGDASDFGMANSKRLRQRQVITVRGMDNLLVWFLL